MEAGDGSPSSIEAAYSSAITVCQAMQGDTPAFMRLPSGSEETALRSQGRRGHGNRILVFTTLPRPMERVDSERHAP